MVSWKRITVAMLCVCLGVTLSSGCAGKTGTSQENETQSKKKESDGTELQSGDGLIYESDRNTTWTDGCVITNKGTGAKVNITVKAEITVPEVKQMSVVEAEGVDTELEEVPPEEDGDYICSISAAGREEIAKAVFDDDDIYPFTFAGGNYLKWDGKKGKTPVKDGDYTGEAYVGNRKGKDYLLHFTKYSGHMIMEPLDWSEAAPGKILDRERFIYAPWYQVPNDTGGLGGEAESVENGCKMTEEEAKKKAEDFLEDIGYGGYSFAACYDLGWTIIDDPRGKDVDEMIENTSEILYNGYAIEYDVGVDNISFPSFGTEAEYYAPIVGTSVSQTEYRKTHEYHEYSMANKFMLYVTDDGVVEAELDSPMKILSETKDVKLLSMESVRQTIMNDMEEYLNLYFEQMRTLGYPEVDEIEYLTFDSLELAYFRVQEDTETNHYSYVPVWRLVNWNRVGPPILMINAIDGTLINVWEGLL